MDKCETCWGLREVCTGLGSGLEPILETCKDCNGTGYSVRCSCGSFNVRQEKTHPTAIHCKCECGKKWIEAV